MFFLRPHPQGTVFARPRRTLKAGVVHLGHVHLHAQVSYLPQPLVTKKRDPETLIKPNPPRVTSISALDESEIIWSKFPDPGWNRWSSYQLRRKWRTIKRSVPEYEKMTPRGEYAVALPWRFGSHGDRSANLSPSSSHSDGRVEIAYAVLQQPSLILSCN
jgi:hypothetical protein